MTKKKTTIRTADLPPAQFKRYQELLAEHTAPLVRFSSVQFANEASHAMRRPYDREEWVALTSAERKLQLKAVARTRAKAALARELAPAPTLTPAPEASTKPVAGPRYVVACADGCGAMIPARGTRPVVSYAQPWHRPKSRLSADS